jgi:hypothetical protein
VASATDVCRQRGRVFNIQQSNHSTRWRAAWRQQEVDEGGACPDDARDAAWTVRAALAQADEELTAITVMTEEYAVFSTRKDTGSPRRHGNQRFERCPEAFVTLLMLLSMRSPISVCRSFNSRAFLSYSSRVLPRYRLRPFLRQGAALHPFAGNSPLGFAYFHWLSIASSLGTGGAFHRVHP